MRKNQLLFLIILTIIAGCKKKPSNISGPEVFDSQKINSLKQVTFLLDIVGKGPLKVAGLQADSFAVIQGDMLVRLLKDSVRANFYQPKSWSVVGKTWPNATVYYKISSGVDAVMVQSAMDEWKTKVGIKFVPVSGQANFVDFVTGNGPSSQVGMTGTRQVVTISGDTQKGNVIHEIGHVLGLWHEQSRSDRASYISVNYLNILPQQKIQYDIIAGVSNGTSYDYNSIMHYPAYSNHFTIDPTKPAIIPLNPGNATNMGQRTGLSTQDIAGVKARYGL